MDVTDAIKPIYKYYVLGGINPFVLIGNRMIVKRLPNHNFYTIGLLVVLTIVYLWTLLDKHLHLYPGLTFNFQVMDMVANGVGYAHCIVTIVTLTNIVRATRIRQLIKYIAEVDKFLIDPRFIDYKKMGKFALHQMGLMMCISVGLICVSLIFSQHNFYTFLKSDFINCVSLLYWPTTSLPILDIPYLLYKRFQVLNSQILQMKTEIHDCGKRYTKKSSQGQLRAVDILAKIHKFEKIYALLGNIGDMYSVAFGPLSIISTIFLTIVVLNFCFESLMFMFDINPYGLAMYDICTKGLCLFVTSMVHTLVTVYWSNATSIEAGSTVQIIYRMILEIPVKGTNGVTHAFKMDLLEMVRQISRRPVILSATNWYQLKYSFVYTILNGVLALFILLIQLNF